MGRIMTETTEPELIVRPEYSKITITQERYNELKNTSVVTGGNVVRIKVHPQVVFIEEENIEEVFIKERLLAYKDDTGYYEIQE